MTKDDGGPAFPLYQGENHFPNNGMSLRDYFAAAVMQGLVGRDIHVNQFGFKQEELNVNQTLSRRAYELADAMLAERSK